MAWLAYYELIGAIRAYGVSVDLATESDCSATVKWWVDAQGNLHIVDVDIYEPTPSAIEMRLVPGSDPPRYEPYERRTLPAPPDKL